MRAVFKAYSDLDMSGRAAEIEEWSLYRAEAYKAEEEPDEIEMIAGDQDTSTQRDDEDNFAQNPFATFKRIILDPRRFLTNVLIKRHRFAREVHLIFCKATSFTHRTIRPNCHKAAFHLNFRSEV
jgi:hypothetical protein